MAAVMSVMAVPYWGSSENEIGKGFSAALSFQSQVPQSADPFAKSDPYVPC